ncbi:[FeFe] hydrogenase H-cluster radical SAM maturase HydE [Campylobacter pinnipediorum]|uniref:[FeFe] hydrogenase H-cluster radical SAM maturase HydE n=1 Tax=Campylobacter pinnipediorum TaxID=1965231 RepID=UPI00084CFC33|nr:[FeFe] hydrogenase H-cluster radical SAM maturase HydE [Campylobacter pinnipediorum]AQW82455.1 [FeFe] hydrogenase H-cluster radical SAM maturase HydE [Campylobacter pinnipediorum subsp. pinnipediorum]OPA74496.1 [FeFe] hydrogenase H-cluster radical SAM maturase HydE [Campylobacter pinnipediorum subsp. pinnipediorum]
MSSLEFINELYNTHTTSLKGLEEIIKDESNCDYLFEAADKTRRKYSKQEVHLKALIEISNICTKTCFYCGLRQANKVVNRYKIEPDDIINYAKEAAQVGYKTIVLQSGESNVFSDDDMCKILSGIKKFGVQITLSLGEKSFEQYKAYKEAGGNRYLLRIETTDEKLYKRFHPGMSLENRIRCLHDLQTLGYETGSGLLVGLPDTNPEILAKDLMFLKKFDFDMVGIGPFIPADNTPLSNEKGGSVHMAIKLIAITRLLLPNINIPATTAIETIDPNEGRKKALKSGANVIMPSITNGKYQDLYRLYPKKFYIKADVGETYTKFDNLLFSIGDKVSLENGDSMRFNQRLK